MKRPCRPTIGLAALVIALAASTVRAQSPDFDAAAWVSMGCGVTEPAGDESPSGVDLVGDATYPPWYMARDGSYLYFRFRVDGDPSGAGGFQSYCWNALMQVPAGNPFQYQYELSLNGKSETTEIWANTAAQNIDFSPLFNDPAEQQLSSSPSAPLARHLVAGDGSNFGGNADYFVDVAFPVSTLVAKGVIAGAADLDASLFFPATATNPNNYNKGYLACPFQPGAALTIVKSVSPTIAPAGSATGVTYTIAVRNDGPWPARGVVIEDPALPAYLGTPDVTVVADDAAVTWTVVSTQPLEVRVPDLPLGKTVTVTLATTATPTCKDNGFVNVATAFATNAAAVQGQATLTLNMAAGGCAPCTSDADCDDANACTTDACVNGACSSTVQPGCTPCVGAADCPDDGNPCTTDACVAGTCAATPIPGCGAPCTTDNDCSSGDPCILETCVTGACAATPNPTCTGGTCTSDTDCDDHDACTTDACVGGACVSAPIAGCPSNPTPPEDCSNGVDDDGDGLVDCADADCAGSPACKVEICGDCIDNDGDGLTDYDDPDCCDAPAPLDLRRMMLSPTPTRANAKKLSLTVRNTGLAHSTLDPVASGATLQISDPSGMVLCQRIPASAWKKRGARVFRFRDKTGTVAGGIKRARFAMKRNGRVPFRTIGKAVPLGHTDGHDVTVTIGVGGQCSRTMTQLRPKGRRMLFP